MNELRLYQVIAELNVVHNAPVTVRLMTPEGWSESKVRRVLKNLVLAGYVFSPARGYYQIAYPCRFVDTLWAAREIKHGHMNAGDVLW